MRRALVAVLCLPALLAAQRADTTFARVTYLSGSSVYIDAGETAGLAADDSLDLLRAGRVIARLRVLYVSSRRAQCDVVASTAAPAEGDTVRFIRITAVAAAPPDTAAVGPRAPVTSAALARPRSQVLRGRIGVRYFTMRQRDSSNASWSQPATDLRLDGPVPNAPNLLVAVDARGRRTNVVTIGGLNSQSRTSTTVYQASLAWRGNGTIVRLGRQYSEVMADVSLFDGALVQRDGTRFGGGLFAGTQPDDATMGFSTRVREYGGYVAAHERAELPRWSTATGVVGSYDGGQVDREYAFASGTWNGSGLSLYVTQQMDYNRGWKKTFESSLVTPTSTLAVLSARVVDAVSVEAGYDSRRNVRLYRNYVTPEIAFDDAFRTGVWGGISARLGRTSLGTDYRRSYGGSSGSADIISASASADAQPWAPLRARLRSSRYTTPLTTGWLHSATLSGDVTRALELEISGGARLDHNRPTPFDTLGTHSQAQWYELGANWAVGRSWFVLLSLTRNLGGWEASDQAFAALTYRF